MSTEDLQQTPEQVAIEKEARTLGWVPKEEFRDGDHWVDAEAFVKRGKEINPILRKNNETLLKKLEQANHEIAEVKKAAKDFERFQTELAEKKVKELQAELNHLKEQKKLAVTAGDGEAVVSLDDAIDLIKEQQEEAKVVKKKETEAPVVVPATLDPIITGWMEKNEWFTSDMKFTRIADAIGANINTEFPDLKGQAFFDKLDEELQDYLPEKYKKKPRTSPVEGNTGPGTRGSVKKHTFENLPDDAKAACDRMIKQGYKMTRESYVKDYDWS